MEEILLRGESAITAFLELAAIGLVLLLRDDRRSRVLTGVLTSSARKGARQSISWADGRSGPVWKRLQ